jgi:hypothetical protein
MVFRAGAGNPLVAEHICKFARGDEMHEGRKCTVCQEIRVQAHDAINDCRTAARIGRRPR